MRRPAVAKRRTRGGWSPKRTLENPLEAQGSGSGNVVSVYDCDCSFRAIPRQSGRDTTMSRNPSRKNKRQDRRASRQTDAELTQTLKSLASKAGAASAKLWGRLLDDWEKPESDKSVPSEVADDAIRIGFNLLLAAAALLSTPDPKGKATQMIATADGCRRERSIRDLTIVVSQAIADDMMDYRMRARRKAAEAVRQPPDGMSNTAGTSTP